MVDETDVTTDDEAASAHDAPTGTALVDTPGSFPEHRPLREQVVRSLAAPEPAPRPVVVGKPVVANDKKSSDGSGDTLVVVAIIAVVIAGLSFVRPSLVANIGTSDAPVAMPIGTSSGAPLRDSSQDLPPAGPSRIDWGDDHHHLVVTAAVAGTATRPPEPPPPTDTSTGSTSVERADGTVSSIDIPDESLELAVPNRQEAAAIRALGEDSVTTPIVVVDVQGVAGTPMGRYIQVDGRLVEPPAASPEPDVPPVVEVEEAELVESLLALPEVAEVTRLAPGLLAVATDDPNIDLASQAGVLTVGDDVLIGLAALPGAQPPASQAPSRRPAIPPATSGPRPLIAVIDTGFDATSSDLAGAWWRNDDECGNGIDDDGNGYVDDCRGWDFGAADADPSPEAEDPFGDHGTEVASVIAAAPNGSGVVGVAPGAAIMALKVSRPTGAIGMSAVAAAVDYAIDNGADVVNLSLVTQPGADRDHMQVLEAAIDRAGDAGVIVVAGAGNDGRNLLLTPAWPASLGAERRHVLTVGALDPDGGPAGFSNRGSAVTFAAPGVAVPVAGCAAGTAWRSGTSYSAPIVSGLIAAVLAAQQPPDLDALLAAVVEQTTLIDGVYMVATAPVVDAPSVAPGGIAPVDPTCRRPSG